MGSLYGRAQGAVPNGRPTHSGIAFTRERENSMRQYLVTMLVTRGRHVEHTSRYVWAHSERGASTEARLNEWSVWAGDVLITVESVTRL